MSKLGALHITQISGTKHTGTIIFFHGSGGTGESLQEWVKLLVRTPFAFPHLRILYPTAPLRAYTPMGGHKSNVWFDRLDITPKVPEHNESLSDIEIQVKQLIKQENDLGIPTSRIIVGGFSMGGALALHTAYRWHKSLAGVFAFSSFLNEQSAVYEDLRASSTENLPPLLQLHGDMDDLVMQQWGKNSFDQLKKLGVDGEYHLLERLGHSINKKGLHIIKDWIEKVLPPEI